MCNISVKVSFSFQWFKHPIFGNSPIESVIDYVVSNKGNESVILKCVTISFCGKTIKTPYGIANGLAEKKRFYPQKFPKELKPNSELSGDFLIENLLKSIGNQLKDTDFIQVTVWDKNGNKYDSEAFTIQDMKNQFIAQKMINESSIKKYERESK